VSDICRPAAGSLPFIAARSTTALLHSKPASVATSRHSCGAQNSDERNALYLHHVKYLHIIKYLKNECLEIFRDFMYGLVFLLSNEEIALTVSELFCMAVEACGLVLGVCVRACARA